MKSAQDMGIHNPLQKLAIGNLGKPELPFRSIARSTGATVIFLTIVPLVDRPVDRAKPSIDCPVDRLTPESGVLSVGRPRGRPAVVAGVCARLVHIGRPTRLTAQSTD